MTQVINAGRVPTLLPSIAGFVAWDPAVDQARGSDWALRSGELLVGVPWDTRALLQKALSLKEIADARQTRECTMREQARAVYRKAELPGLASLSVFFWRSCGCRWGMTRGCRPSAYRPEAVSAASPPLSALGTFALHGDYYRRRVLITRASSRIYHRTNDAPGDEIAPGIHVARGIDAQTAAGLFEAAVDGHCPEGFAHRG